MKKRKFKINYLKFVIFISIIILAYIIFYERNLTQIHDFLSNLGYIGTFLTGSLYTYGFTSPIATAILLILAKEQNIFIAALIGGLGSLFSDLIIFNSVRYSFEEEVKFLSRKRNKSINFLTKYLFAFLGALIIASPLPDELGISLLAINKKISTKRFTFISYILNTIGIFIILFIGRSL